MSPLLLAFLAGAVLIQGVVYLYSAVSGKSVLQPFVRPELQHPPLATRVLMGCAHVAAAGWLLFRESIRAGTPASWALAAGALVMAGLFVRTGLRARETP